LLSVKALTAFRALFCNNKQFNIFNLNLVETKSVLNLTQDIKSSLKFSAIFCK